MKVETDYQAKQASSYLHAYRAITTSCHKPSGIN